MPLSMQLRPRGRVICTCAVRHGNEKAHIECTMLRRDLQESGIESMSAASWQPSTRTTFWSLTSVAELHTTIMNNMLRLIAHTPRRRTQCGQRSLPSQLATKSPTIAHSATNLQPPTRHSAHTAAPIAVVHTTTGRVEKRECSSDHLRGTQASQRCNQRSACLPHTCPSPTTFPLSFVGAGRDGSDSRRSACRPSCGRRATTGAARVRSGSGSAGSACADGVGVGGSNPPRPYVSARAVEIAAAGKGAVAGSGDGPELAATTTIASALPATRSASLLDRPELGELPTSAPLATASSPTPTGADSARPSSPNRHRPMIICAHAPVSVESTRTTRGSPR